MNQMLETAGVESPFPKDLSNPENHQTFFDQAKQMFGLEGTPFENLPGPGDEGRPEFIEAMQLNVSNVVTQLTGATLGAEDPGKALSELKPIDLQMPGGEESPGPPKLLGGDGSRGTPFGGSGPPAVGSGQTPQFSLSADMKRQILNTGSRQNMLSSSLGGLTKTPKAGGARPGGGGPQAPSGRGGPGGPPGLGR